TLDIDQLNYDAWSELFVSHLDSFDLMDHIEGTTIATESEWKNVDSLVKVWLYGTLSMSLLQMEACALELESELRSMDLGSMSISKYCKRIKVISDLLANIDALVEEKTLVMYAINGLNEKFEHVTSIIRHSTKHPILLEAWSMLLVEE
nr:hypothetical protein [Tanacetum cinerariifolium]